MQLFQPLGLLAITGLFAAIIGCEQAQANSMRVYFGTYTGEKSKGIYQSTFDAKTGKLTAPQLAVETKNPSYLAVHPNRKFMYAVGEVSDFEGKKSGVVSAFAIEPDTGNLRLLNQQASGGTSPCHLSLDSEGRCVLVANYGGGSVQAIPILETGVLGQPGVFVQHEGSSVNPKRQAGPHAHQIVPDPENRFALVCDLGLDKVLVYQLNAGRAMLALETAGGGTVTPGAGPRHLVFHPKRSVAYVINEMGNSITVFDWEGKTGVLKQIQEISTLPTGYTNDSSCAEIAVHPKGDFLYGSNRGHDSIAIFRVDSKTGQLTAVGHQPSGGKAPRHFAFDPSGDWIIAQNQSSDNILVFRVDSKTGTLQPVGEPTALGSPVCAVFVPSKAK